MNFTAYYLLVKNEFCLGESCLSLQRQGVDDFFFSIPSEYWNGSDVPEEDIRQIVEIVDMLKEIGCKVAVARPNIQKLAGMKYIDKETWVRNENLREMRRRRCPAETLVVDADEWWRDGSLQSLEQIVEDHHPKALTMKAVQVAGYPGYPVVSDQEGLLVYVHNKRSLVFTHGRCVNEIDPFEIEIPGVFHFTATRWSLDETIVTLRKSSHYDDPNYDFEKWIIEELPNIKPGASLRHMYTRWSPWQGVRSFTQEEWSELPDTLKWHLGEPE